MQIELGSYHFPGFYESLFCYSDEFIDDEEEVKYMIEEYVSADNFRVEYEYDDFESYKEDVCDSYSKYYMQKIIEVLPEEIVNHSDFKFMKTDDDIQIISPKYYNYSTDQCYWQVETNEFSLQKIKDYTLAIPEAKEYIREKYTSRDGFISLISNDIKEWKGKNIVECEENMLIALMDMLIDLSDCVGFENIKTSTHYDIDKYYYTTPVIYCNSQEVKDKIYKHFNFCYCKVIE